MIVREDKACEGGRHARADGRRAKTRCCRFQRFIFGQVENMWVVEWSGGGVVGGEEEWRGMFFVVEESSFRLTQHGCGT